LAAGPPVDHSGRIGAANPESGGVPMSSEPITIANEFAEVRVRRVDTRNGARLLIESPRSGQWIALCPLELEALTWQSPQTFSAMIGNPMAPLVSEGEP
jgi:hypothetical protein